MDKTSLLLAAGHTIARKLSAACKLTLQTVLGLITLVATMSTCILAVIGPSTFFFVVWFTPDACALCLRHQSLFFQGSGPSVTLIALYVGSVAAAHASLMFMGLRAGFGNPAQCGLPTKTSAIVASALTCMGQGFQDFPKSLADYFVVTRHVATTLRVTQPATQQPWRAIGRIAANSAKMILGCLATPLIFLSVFFVIIEPLPRLIAQAISWARKSAPTLEGLAAQSPEILARREAASLGLTAFDSQNKKEAPRL